MSEGPDKLAPERRVRLIQRVTQRWHRILPYEGERVRGGPSHVPVRVRERLNERRDGLRRTKHSQRRHHGLTDARIVILQVSQERPDRPLHSDSAQRHRRAPTDSRISALQRLHELIAHLQRFHAFERIGRGLADLLALIAQHSDQHGREPVSLSLPKPPDRCESHVFVFVLDHLHQHIECILHAEGGEDPRDPCARPRMASLQRALQSAYHLGHTAGRP